MRDKKEVAKPPNTRRRGGAGQIPSYFLTNTTPAPIKRWATPPFQEGSRAGMGTKPSRAGRFR
jgi:hypothetical protein